MKISVIIPVRNGSNYLKEALESIAAQGLDTETIVVDDGSVDNTAEIAAVFGARVLRHPESRGQVVAKNTGLAAATGDCVLFLDHDDRIREGALRTMGEALQAHPEAAAVQAKVKDFLSPEIDRMDGTVIRPDAYYGLFTGAILIRREAFAKTGPFPENIHDGEIIYWHTRMEQCGLAILKLDLVSTDRRIHNTNFGKTNKEKEYKDFATILRARLKGKK